MITIKRFIKDKILHLVELIPFARDFFLVLTKGRQDISYRGVFDTWEQARKAASRKKANDYDVINAKKASNNAIEKQRLDHWFHDADYPLLFWLTKLFVVNNNVLELGGSLGHFFYSMQKYTTMPNDLRWTIAELPEAVNLGRAIAQERQEDRLFFIESNDIYAMSPVDIFMTAGTLQYMNETLPGIINTFSIKPKHILIHNLPIHAHKSFYTLQNLNLCEVPYHVYSKSELLNEMNVTGYDLVAEWLNQRTIEIPFHPFLKINGYSGFYFTKRDDLF